MVSRVDKVLGVRLIGLNTKTDFERSGISKAPVAKAILLEHGSQLVDTVSIVKVELRQYREKADRERRFYSLITVYLKTSIGEGSYRAQRNVGLIRFNFLSQNILGQSTYSYLKSSRMDFV